MEQKYRERRGSDSWDPAGLRDRLRAHPAELRHDFAGKAGLRSRYMASKWRFWGWLFLVLLIVVHVIFKVVKFTFMLFLFGVAVVSLFYIFQHYFGIDLVAEISKHM